MFAQGVELAVIGMTSVFLFLLLLIALMSLQAFILKYLGISDEKASSDDESSLIAAAIAVKLKNN